MAWRREDAVGGVLGAVDVLDVDESKFQPFPLAPPPRIKSSAVGLACGKEEEGGNRGEGDDDRRLVEDNVLNAS